MENEKICFITACDEESSYFIIPYAIFAHAYNKNSEFIFIVDFKPTDKLNFGINYLNSKGIKADLVKNKSGFPASTSRYLYVPKTDAKYAYISDIDILICEPIIEKHIEQMKSTGLPFDNKQRIGKRQFTGLHFVECKKYFTKEVVQVIEKILSEKKQINHECALYDICEVHMKYTKHDLSKNARPVHGICLSQNKSPYVTIPDKNKNDAILNFLKDSFSLYQHQLTNTLNSEIYKGSDKYLDGRFVSVLNRASSSCALGNIHKPLNLVHRVRSVGTVKIIEESKQTNVVNQVKTIDVAKTLEDLEIWKEPKPVTKYDSEYTKIHLIHWYFKGRNKLELSDVEKFHFSMLYMSDFDCKFDEIYFSVALDNTNNELEKQFIKSKIAELTKFGTAKIDVSFIQNDASKGELDTWLRIFDFTYNREDKCLLFYSHFKGIRYDVNNIRYNNDKYWCYLMYQGCLLDGFNEGQKVLTSEVSYGAFLRTSGDDSCSRIINEIKSKNELFSFVNVSDTNYVGTYYFLNLKKLYESLNSHNIKKENIFSIYDKTYVCPYVKTHSSEYFLTSLFYANQKTSQWSYVSETCKNINNLDFYRMFDRGYFYDYISNYTNRGFRFSIKDRDEKIVVAMTS